MTEATTTSTKSDRPDSAVPNPWPSEALLCIAENTAALAEAMNHKMWSGTEDAASFVENEIGTTSTRFAELNRKMMESAESSARAMLDHATALLTAASAAEAIELSATHARKQFDTLLDQTKKIVALVP
jgi:hypothetical protein